MKSLKKFLQFQLDSTKFSSKIKSTKIPINDQKASLNIEQTIRTITQPENKIPQHLKIKNNEINNRNSQFDLSEEIIVDKNKQVLLYYHRLSVFINLNRKLLY